MHGQRIWTQRDQRLMTIAIGNEVVHRCVTQGTVWTALSADDLRLLRYRIYLDFTTGTTAGEARAKQAQLFRYLDSGIVPILATQVVPFATPDLAAA